MGSFVIKRLKGGSVLKVDDNQKERFWKDGVVYGTNGEENGILC